MHPGVAGLPLPNATFDATVNTQLAFVDNLHVFPVDTSTIAGFKVATTVPNTGYSSSQFVSTPPGPLVVSDLHLPWMVGDICFHHHEEKLYVKRHVCFLFSSDH